MSLNIHLQIQIDTPPLPPTLPPPSSLPLVCVSCHRPSGARRKARWISLLHCRCAFAVGAAHCLLCLPRGQASPSCCPPPPPRRVWRGGALLRAAPVSGVVRRLSDGTALCTPQPSPEYETPVVGCGPWHLLGPLNAIPRPVASPPPPPPPHGSCTGGESAPMGWMPWPRMHWRGGGGTHARPTEWGSVCGGRPGQRVEEQGTWASRTRKLSQARCGRPEDGGVWTAKTVKRPPQQPEILSAADAQTAHPATSSTASAHQPLGSANAETTQAGAPAAAADRKQRPDATCEGTSG